MVERRGPKRRFEPQWTAERKCLGCGLPFRSAGIGNRICQTCKVANEVLDHGPSAYKTSDEAAQIALRTRRRVFDTLNTEPEVLPDF